MQQRAPPLLDAAALHLQTEPQALPSRVWDVLRLRSTRDAVLDAGTASPDQLLDVAAVRGKTWSSVGGVQRKTSLGCPPVG